MITSFADRTTEDIFHGLGSKQARRIPSAVWKIVARKLDMLNAAHDVRDLRTPPGNRIEQLKDKWTGSYSIRVNDQFRVVFQWVDGNAKDVLITDYH